MAVSRRRFLTRSLVVGAAVPLAGSRFSPFEVSRATAAPGLPEWSPNGAGSTFAIDRAMAVSTTALTLTASGAGGGPRRTRAEDIAPFTMLGATVAASAAPGEVRVRALLTNGWSPWMTLSTSSGHGPDRPGSGAQATDPIWFGGATGYELEVSPGRGPVDLHLVRPTDQPVVTAPPAGERATEAGVYTPPPVRPRADWGAAPYRGSVDTAAGLSRAVVHHTVNDNGYSAAQVPSMLRSIQAYHQNSRGWDDIGYNFVIDRFGTVWEGRAGSLYQPVIGAHASDANTGSVGVAYLGDGNSAGLTAGAVTALGRFLGWKLPLHGARPSQTNIVGHRDVGQSACPGGRVYGQLGAIRSKAISLAPPVGPFFDVPNADPRARHLRWGRTTGVVDARLDGTFGPAQNVSRADNVYWLWHFAGEPVGTVPHGFNDIPNNAYYREAVRWARGEGIVRMTGNAKFRPNAEVTRQQAALQLWRFAGRPDPSLDHTYTDVPDGVAEEAGYDWADAYGIVTSSAFGRAVKVTRSESVDLLYRLRTYTDVPRATSPATPSTGPGST